MPFFAVSILSLSVSQLENIMSLFLVASHHRSDSQGHPHHSRTGVAGGRDATAPLAAPCCELPPVGPQGQGSAARWTSYTLAQSLSTDK